MYIRELTEDIQRRLANISAVAILGPRQIGKTTLALAIAEQHQSVYLDLENPNDMKKLHDPVAYFDNHADKLIILDEVQRFPDLFMVLRGIIDNRRREGRGNGRFLILGSATNELLKQSSESLAGRIHYAELAGLRPSEIEAANGKYLRKLWVRGGFPDSYQATSDQDSFEWRQQFIRTYVERDIPQLGPRIPATTLMRFWTMLAHEQGELLNASKIAGALDVQSVTVSRYLDMMVDLMLVRRLLPWHGNIKKRLVKSPRVYIRDSGVSHALLQLSNYDSLLSHPVISKSWEGFVIEQILSSLPLNVNPYFYRTSAGSEIDLLLELGHNKFWAIEIKSSSAPKLSKGFYIACDDLQVERKFIIYTGEEEYPYSNDTTAISLPDFIRLVKGTINKQ